MATPSKKSGGRRSSVLPNAVSPLAAQMSEEDILKRRAQCVLMSGWLQVRGAFKKWSTRFFVLTPGRLNYYKEPPASPLDHEEGHYNLVDCEVNERVSKKPGFCFKITSVTGSTVTTGAIPGWGVGNSILLVETKADLNNWLEAIRSAIYLGADTHPEVGQVIASLASRRDAREAGHEPIEAPASEGDASGGSSRPSSIAGGRGPAVGAVPDVPGTPRVYSVPAPVSDDEDESSEPVDDVGNESSDFFSSSDDERGGGQKGSSAKSKFGTPSLATRSLPSSRAGGGSSGAAAASSSSPPLATSTPAEYVTETYYETEEYSDVETVEGKGKAEADAGSVRWERVTFEGLADDETGDITEAMDPNADGLVKTLLKQVRPGMDLSKIVLPTFILEPRSFLEKLTDFFGHCDVLSEAMAIEDDSLRMVGLMKWYVSGFYIRPKGVKKPYNPILGEVFRAKWVLPSGSETFFISEQVSHHPPISALYVTNRTDGWALNASVRATSTFRGYYVTANLVGTAYLTDLRRGHTYVLDFPSTMAKGFLTGSLSSEIVGDIKVTCEETDTAAELSFHSRSIVPFTRQVSNEVVGKIKRGGEVFATINGFWNSEINISLNGGEPKPLWTVKGKSAQRVPFFRPAFDDQGEWESVKLWHKVTAAILAGDQVAATEEKHVLEEAQRAAKNLLKETGGTHQLKLFDEDTDPDRRFVYKYINLTKIAAGEAALVEKDFKLVIAEPVTTITTKRIVKKRRVAKTRRVAKPVMSSSSNNVSGMDEVEAFAMDNIATEKAAAPSPVKSSGKSSRASASASPLTVGGGVGPSSGSGSGSGNSGSGSSTNSSSSNISSATPSTGGGFTSASSSGPPSTATSSSSAPSPNDALIAELQSFRSSAQREIVHLTTRLNQLEKAKASSVGGSGGRSTLSLVVVLFLVLLSMVYVSGPYLNGQVFKM